MNEKYNKTIYRSLIQHLKTVLSKIVSDGQMSAFRLRHMGKCPGG